MKTTNLCTFMEERGLPCLRSELTLLETEDPVEEETYEDAKNLFPSTGA